MPDNLPITEETFLFAKSNGNATANFRSFLSERGINLPSNASVTKVAIQ
jgi:hypothetical protein